ncbi:MAG: hypothetical protein BWX84_01888 [Verrucomicrobia bacterium ADurb.Bin118]|nr:MAG: hypothetical protein BWX84_01888 [Verrucomicrobia bacterium ADurb.Bin118]
MLPGIGQQRLARHIQQRPNQGEPGAGGGRRPPFHAAEPFAARSAKQTEKEQLDLIIGVMGQGHRRGLEMGGRLGEKSVARFARGHFQRQFLGPGE